jgi:serine/threonine protein kinase
LHENDIIYRDLKPENIVFDLEGNALLTDFGLSKEGIKNNSVTATFCGSQEYLAPEMLSNKAHGKNVDWYHLGILLYEMLIGKTPFTSKDQEKLIFNIQEGAL